MPTYTVASCQVASLASEATSFVDVIDAPTPTLAGRRIRLQGKNRRIIAVFEGAHRDHYESSLDNRAYERQIQEEDEVFDKEHNR